MFSLRNRFKKSTSQQPYNLHIRAKKTYLNDYISPEFYNDLNYNSLSSQTGHQQSINNYYLINLMTHIIIQFKNLIIILSITI